MKYQHNGFVVLLSSWLPAILLFGVMVSACDQPQPQTSAQSDTVTGTPAQQPSEHALLWPFINDQEHIALADNLLASNIYVVFDGSGSMSQSACSGGEAKIVAANAKK